MLRRSLLVLFVWVVRAQAACGLLPQTSVPTDHRVIDDAAIRWFLPGQFEEAVASAKSSKRLLLLKGISFGIDAAGATCATKGTW